MNIQVVTTQDPPLIPHQATPLHLLLVASLFVLSVD